MADEFPDILRVQRGGMSTVWVILEKINPSGLCVLAEGGNCGWVEGKKALCRLILMFFPSSPEVL